MATFNCQHGRRRIYFTDHALDRWWQRCKQNDVYGRQHAMDLLRSSLEEAIWSRSLPPWSRLSIWHQARAEGFLRIGDEAGFVVNRNENGDLVAVSYIESYLNRVPA
jgi:hypothetical protein